MSLLDWSIDWRSGRASSTNLREKINCLAILRTEDQLNEGKDEIVQVIQHANGMDYLKEIKEGISEEKGLRKFWQCS